MRRWRLRIADEDQRPRPDSETLTRLKIEKLRVKEEMERLRRTQTDVEPQADLRQALSGIRRGGGTARPSRSSRSFACAIGGVQVGLAAQAQDHRIARLDVGAVPVGALAHLLDGVLGGAEQLADLRLGQLRVVAQQEGDASGRSLRLATGV